jgi:hypothetical protein
MAGEAICERSIDGSDRITVATLSTAEQFVLGVCRCWDAFMDDPDPTLAWRELTPVFTYMNVVRALCAFERTFVVLRRHRLRTLRFQDVDSTQVGSDEARLLCGLACLQRGLAHAAIVVLSESMTAVGVRSILPPMARIAAILDAQGHRLPSWHPVRLRQRREGPWLDETFLPPLHRAQ